MIFFLIKLMDSNSTPNNINNININQIYLAKNDNSNNNSATQSNLDSTSLSGNVGTALYVAPELLIKQTNKYLYTQVSVKIYILVFHSTVSLFLESRYL
jgi:hypothetical protein